MDSCYTTLRSTYRKVSTKLDLKLKRLIQQSNWCKHSNRDIVINLSDRQLDNNTIAALGYGLSFATSNGTVNFVDIAKGFCNLKKYSDVSVEDINVCKGMMYGVLLNNSVPNCPSRFIHAFKNLKKDNSLHITKAEKSNTVVIMNKDDYVREMELLLEDMDTYLLVNRDPTEKVIAHFNKTLKTLWKGDKELISRLSSRSPSLPYMYGLIKKP
ncbi:uncharacterized protein [Procambarus clarkii]|uniref:uncharacterized protein n=1 Tax=Procambarus clarkii TaxID=6728 RepID=UPI003743358B